MAKKKKKTKLPGIELMIIAVFFFSFILWAMSKCNLKRMSYEDIAQNVIDSSSIVKDVLVKNPAIKDSILQQKPKNIVVPPTVTTPPIIKKYTPLYVAIDSLKLRRGPGLQHGVLMRLPLHAELQFLNEVSDSTQIIVIGGVEYNEPWSKVQTSTGRIGWVYGGCVDYYMKTIPSGPQSIIR